MRLTKKMIVGGGQTLQRFRCVTLINSNKKILKNILKGVYYDKSDTKSK